MHASFDEWWAPFEAGVGPGGAHIGALSERQRDELRESARGGLPDGRIELRARCWAARGTA